jgi:Flp pilus assembly protein TadD
MKKRIIAFVSFFSLFVFCQIGFSQDLFPEQIYEKVNDCVVVVLSYNQDDKLISLGSGVVYNEKGYIVTNFHVLNEGKYIVIKHYDKTIKDVKIIGFDVNNDLLILKVQENIFHPIKIADISELKVGQRIYAIGSPLGLENTISEGIIGGLRYFDELGREFIQITASISHGSSGGAVVNSRGELIGISTLSMVEGQNLNFAIKISEIKNINIYSVKENDIEIHNLLYKGNLSYESGKYIEAILYFTKFIKEYPNDYKAYNSRGNAYAKLKDYDKAISDYNKAIEIKPDIAGIYDNRGISYDKLKDYIKAIQDYDKAIELNPDDYGTYVRRGFAYYGLKNYTLAISNYTDALNIKPNLPEIYVFRGIAFFKNGDSTNACNDFYKAKELDGKDVQEIINKYCK